jgi:hypothetical protein
VTLDFSQMHPKNKQPQPSAAKEERRSEPARQKRHESIHIQDSHDEEEDVAVSRAIENSMCHVPQEKRMASLGNRNIDIDDDDNFALQLAQQQQLEEWEIFDSVDVVDEGEKRSPRLTKHHSQDLLCISEASSDIEGVVDDDNWDLLPLVASSNNNNSTNSNNSNASNRTRNNNNNASNSCSMNSGRPHCEEDHLKRKLDVCLCLFSAIYLCPLL